MSKKKSTVRKSINIKLIRHAESQNNQVYRSAHHLFKNGTENFDQKGWNLYVNEHRSHDPGLSDIGKRQAECLGDFLQEHWKNQALHPCNEHNQVIIITSPMRRALETIKPALEKSRHCIQQVKTIVAAFYHESEGCHKKGVAQPGMSPIEIRQVFLKIPDLELQFEGFDADEHLGWWCNGISDTSKTEETRQESEVRASKFYNWLCDYLDVIVLNCDDDLREDSVFDAGVMIDQKEENEHEYDKLSSRFRRRKHVCLVGHGDFMSLLLKRIISGFGHGAISEISGISHRAGLVHWNTGITELEYFGAGRFLLMSSNNVSHLGDNLELVSGGGLRDGWSYLMPSFAVNEEYIEIKCAKKKEELEVFVLEQIQSMRSLYMKKDDDDDDDDYQQIFYCLLNEEKSLDQEKMKTFVSKMKVKEQRLEYFIAKRGHQVLGYALLSNNVVIQEFITRPQFKESGIDFKLMEGVKYGQSNQTDFLLMKKNHLNSLQNFGFLLLGPMIQSDVRPSSCL